MSPYLEAYLPLSVNPPKKKTLLWELYKLSRAAEKLENKRIAIIEKVKRHARPKLALYQRAEKAVRKAQSYVETAEAIYAQLPRPRENPPWVSLLGEAKTKIDEAQRNIKIKTGLLVGEIHPSMQKNPKLEPYFLHVVNEEYGELEKKWVDDYQRAWSIDYDLDHFRSRAVEHWLILEADSLLQKHLSVKNIQRHKIIKPLLEAALSQPFELKAINSVLYRRKKFLESLPH